MKRGLLAVLVVAAACSGQAAEGPTTTAPTSSVAATSTAPPDPTTTSTPSTTSTASTTSTIGGFDPAAGPVDGDFYTAPVPLPAGSPGDIVWVEDMVAPDGARAWKVLYQSLGVDGEPIAVSGWVAVPPEPGSHRVLVFGHGTVGLGDGCAPTIQGGATPFQFGDYLDAGWTVAFTDYQGLGTPGLHHYLVAEAEARSLLDVARAARRIDPDATTEIALFGFSQGGHAVLSAAELAPELAPELDIVATIAAAPAFQLREWFAQAPPADLGYLGMIAAAYADAYDQPIEAWLGPTATAALPQITDGCFFDAAQALAALGPEALADAAPDSIVGDLLEANEPALVRLEAPLLLVTGGRDRLFTPDLEPMLIERMCGTGTEVATLHFPEASHIQLASLARAPALSWLETETGDGVITSVCGPG